MIRFPVAALTISVCFVVLLFTAGEGRASERIKEANDNIRLALDILNFTSSGDKTSRDQAKVLDAEHCIFEVGPNDFAPHQTMSVNNIIPETVNFTKVQFSGGGTLFQVNFRGDEPVWGDSTSGTIDLYSSDLGFVERVRKAWGLLFSKACKGASPSEF